MARHRDGDWDLPDDISWDKVPVAVLMDIRDELKTLNRLLRCPNFLGMPHALDKIERNTRKRPRKRKPR